MSRPAAKFVFVSVMAMMAASAAGAQAPTPVLRSSVEMSTTAGMPEFRDPKTGQIWTPENVGQGPIGKPTPADLAFDPLAQAQRIKGVVVQRPGFTPLGWPRRPQGRPRRW